MDPADIERTIREALQEQAPEVVAAWLFGSVARGQARRTSDVDVAILLDDPAPPSTLEDLPLDLEAELSAVVARPVQVVVMNFAPYDLVHRVLRDGHLLIDRDRSRRIQFEVDARNRFFDMQPIWRVYRRVS